MINAMSDTPANSTPTGSPSFDQVVSQIKKDAGAVSPPPYNVAPKRKTSMRGILGVLALVILIVGGIVAYTLTTNTNQTTDLRQQAAGENVTPACGNTCTTTADCPSGNTCSANKCMLTACATKSSDCDTSLCKLATAAQKACNLSFNVGTSTIACVKTSYRDELNNSAGNYSLNQQQSTFRPGETIVFKVELHNNSNQTLEISAQDILKQNNLENVTFLDSNCGNGAYTSGSRTLNCPAVSLAAGATTNRIFRVRVNSGVANGTTITNNLTASAANNQTSCSAAVTVNVQTTPTPSTYACNSSCTSNAQCQGVNGSYICFNNYCRLDSNPNSTTCTPPTTTVVGCNQVCSTTADCSSSDQICMDTTGGRVCRLAANPNSSTCTYSSSSTPTPATVTYSSPTTQTTQPSQLPVTGAGEDMVKFFGVGAGVLILGAAGLLLLL
jgi:hypothetical protein